MRNVLVLLLAISIFGGCGLFLDEDTAHPHTTVDGWFALQEMILEPSPCDHYIHQLFQYAKNRLSDLVFCRLWNAFLLNPVDFIEAHYYFQPQYFLRRTRSSFMFEGNFLLAHETSHPFLFDEWFGLLEYVLTHDISEGARQLVVNFIHFVNDNTPVYHAIGGIPTRAFVFARDEAGEPIDRFYGFRRDGVHPEWRPEWTYYHAWERYGFAGGATSWHLMHWVQTFSVSMHSDTRILHFPFWRWINVDTAGYYPLCPIWFLTLMSNNLFRDNNPDLVLRDILIIELVEHVAELRGRGFDMYRDIVAMLTDSNSVFDPYTRDTFNKVQFVLDQHNLRPTKWAN